MIRHVLAALVVASSLTAGAKAWGAAPQVLDLDGGWRFRIAPADAAGHPQAADWMAAAVPGAVQTDLMALHKLPDPYIGDNEAKVQWVGLSDWQYRCEIDVSPETLARDHLDLVFEGLDTFAEVKVNGTSVLKADNMFRTWRVPVRGVLHAGKNVIEVDLNSPIKTMAPKVAAMPYVMPGAYDSAFGDEPLGRNSSTYVRKAGYQYGWDWGPRVVALGIWKPVRLEAWDGARLADFHVAQVHLDDQVAALEADVDIASDGVQPARVTIDVAGPDGSHQTVTQDAGLFAGTVPVRVPLRIDNPKRWWPVGYGRPDLYTIKASVSQGGQAVGTITRRIGLRTAEIRRQPDQWGRSFELVINGVPVFAKGANMIPFDMFPARVTAAQQDRILQSAVDANMNILRIWGGGTYQDDHVYDKADELGLMIWQDFMFGGAIPPYDRDFRENTRIEATEQVRRLRNHPSIVLWAGNNEVQTDWENWGGSTKDVKTALSPEERDKVVTGMVRLFDNVLRSAVDLNAPDTPYWASTPSTDYDGPADQDTDGDRHYWSVWGGKPVEEYLNAPPRFMSEYGLQSFPVMETIKAFAGPDDLQPETPVMRAHQKYDKGNGNKRLLFYINNNYGQPKDFASFVYLSQVMQAEGIELAATHLRAAMPQSMGSMYWQINDVWPGASWSSIDWFGRWKALQYHARRFYAPVIVTALRKDGVTSLNLVSDEGAPRTFDYRLRVMDLDGKMLSDRSRSVTVSPRSSLKLDALSDADLLKGAASDRTYVVADLLDHGARVSRAIAYFVPSKALALHDPKIRAELKAVPGGYALTLSSATLARQVWIDLGAVDARPSDNAFDLLPGEPETVTFTSSKPPAAVRAALSVRSLYGAVQ
jgi:beta-mannosidase